MHAGFSRTSGLWYAANQLFVGGSSAEARAGAETAWRKSGSSLCAGELCLAAAASSGSLFARHFATAMAAATAVW